MRLVCLLFLFVVTYTFLFKFMGKYLVIYKKYIIFAR